MLASKTGRTALYPGCNHEDCSNHESRTRTKYVYDAEGRRVHESVGGVVKEYLYGNSGQEVSVVDANQNLTAGETYVGGRYLGTQTPGAFNYAYSDNLGTVRQRSNGEADTNWPFGEFASYQNGTSPTHFTGKLFDSEDNLDYFGARYYSPTLGRFMTPDWSAAPEAVPYADLANPQSLNLYSYVGNNPVSRVDADGHKWPSGGFWNWLGNAFVAATTGTSVMLLNDGVRRAQYTSAAAQLSGEGATEAREALKAGTYSNLSPIGKGVTEAARAARTGQLAGKTASELAESAARTNPAINSLGTVSEALGTAGLAVTAGVAAHDIASAPPGQRGAAIANQVGSIGGGIAGGYGGAWLGGAIGTLIEPGGGSAIGALIGSLIGGGGGAAAGQAGSTLLYNEVSHE